MDWNLIVGLASLGFAPITVWLATKQLQQEQRLNSAYSIQIERVHGPFPELKITHKGITPLHQFEVWATVGGQWNRLHSTPRFEPGDLLVTRMNLSELEEVMVAWFDAVPCWPGLRAEALRVRYRAGAPNRVEVWRYGLLARFRLYSRKHLSESAQFRQSNRPTRVPLGRWARHKRLFSREGDRPGWPTTYTET